jgi:AmiR/NasT family two-component response regulator
MLMHAEGLDQPAAFEKLRQQARGQRRKLEDMAAAVIGNRSPSEPRNS